MKSQNSFALTALLVALPCLAASEQLDSHVVLVTKHLSPGVRLHAVDGERQHFPRSLSLGSGTHVLEFNYAYDANRDHNGPWVSRFKIECSFSGPGTYSLRSRDTPVADLTPNIWLESEQQSTPKCTKVGG